MAFIRKFRTNSGATGVQICEKRHGVIVKTTHIGSAWTKGEIRLLEKQAQDIIDKQRTPLFDLKQYEVKDKTEVGKGTIF